jgi:hypothetical protein
MATKSDRNIGINDATPQDWDQASALARQVGGHHEKGGVQDVDKIIHYAELLKELVYGQK